MTTPRMLHATTSSITKQDISIPATDGFPLTATRYETNMPNGESILINSGMAIRRRFYDRFAHFLAQHGFTVYTYDYRGIGDSRPASLRKFKAFAHEWGEKDTAGMIEHIATHRPEKILAIGHSMGGQLIGLAANNARIGQLVTVAAQNAYWGHWKAPQKYGMALLWTCVVPISSYLYGYFPGSKLGMVNDVPQGVALEWAHWCRSRRYFFDSNLPSVNNFTNLRVSLTAYSFEDDWYAPRKAVDTLAEAYACCSITRKHFTPADLGVRQVGHFSVFTDQFAATFWPEVLQAIQQNSG